MRWPDPSAVIFPFGETDWGCAPKPQKVLLYRGFRGCQSPNSSFLKGKATPPGRGGRNWVGLAISYIFLLIDFIESLRQRTISLRHFLIAVLYICREISAKRSFNTHQLPCIFRRQLILPKSVAVCLTASVCRPQQGASPCLDCPRASPLRCARPDLGFQT